MQNTPWLYVFEPKEGENKEISCSSVVVKVTIRATLYSVHLTTDEKNSLNVCHLSGPVLGCMTWAHTYKMWLYNMSKHMRFLFTVSWENYILIK